MKRHSRFMTGFTIVELMIVVTIIAIIATIAIPNLLRSRMAANETNAVSYCKQYVAAQAIYIRNDWDGDGVKEYATNVLGPYGLYTNNLATPGDVALVDRAFAYANGDQTTATAKSGYLFSILTSQTANAPGGAVNYFKGPNLVLGHALSCIPHTWDLTGRNCFQVNHDGLITQRDRGSAGHLTAYDPDPNWVMVQ